MRLNLLIVLCMVGVGKLHAACTVCATQRGDTALMWAAEYGQTACVRALVEAGANKNAKDKVRA
jgi:ankyrin repeat protein